MREIKFRAWDAKGKEMFRSGDFPPQEETTAHLMTMDMEGMGLLFDGQPIACDECGSFAYLTPDRYILMQYTGLEDKNGVEIYEGDVLQYPDSNIREVVKWVENMWTEEGYMTGFGELTFTFDQYEIIGNIYENPDLVKE